MLARRAFFCSANASSSAETRSDSFTSPVRIKRVSKTEIIKDIFATSRFISSSIDQICESLSDLVFSIAEVYH